jgi:hypothetical protein
MIVGCTMVKLRLVAGALTSFVWHVKCHIRHCGHPNHCFRLHSDWHVLCSAWWAFCITRRKRSSHAPAGTAEVWTWPCAPL